MSTGADCSFVEVSPGKWKYRIQQWPYGEWPEYDVNGPFNSFNEALEHLNSNYANPGGWDTKVHANHVHEFEYDDWRKEILCVSCWAVKEE